jgi:hypothetical protein
MMPPTTTCEILRTKMVRTKASLSKPSRDLAAIHASGIAEPLRLVNRMVQREGRLQ